MTRCDSVPFMNHATMSPVAAAMSGTPGPPGEQDTRDAEQQAAVSVMPAGSTGARLLRFAMANIARRPARFLLSPAGIALALMAGVLVRALSVGVARFPPAPPAAGGPRTPPL